MSTPKTPKGELDNRVKNMGYDIEFVRQLGRLEELKVLVEKGQVKPEVYKQLEDAVFKTKQPAPEGNSKQGGMLKKFFNKGKRATGGDKVASTGGGNPIQTTFSKIRNVTSRSRTDSWKSNVSTKSNRSLAGKFKDSEKEVFRGELLKFVKKKARKDWRPIFVVLFQNKLEFRRNGGDDRVLKTVELNEDFFVSTCEGGVIKKAMETNDGNESEDEFLENREDMFFGNVAKTEEIMQKSHVFCVANLTKKTKFFFACDSEEQRGFWVAMFVEVIRDMRRGSGDENGFRKGSKKIWDVFNNQTNNFLKKKVGGVLDANVSELSEDELKDKMNQWEMQGNKIATKQVASEWRSREQAKLRQIKKENEELHVQLNEKDRELKEFEKKKQEEIQQIKEEKEEELKAEKEKNVEWNQKYDDLMAKYRAEALARNTERKSEEDRIKKRINALQRRSMMPHSEEAQFYREQLEQYKAKLETLQKALNVNLDEMDWDGTLEQAEERMQECLQGILNGESEQIRQKAQTDFDKWDQLVRSHQDYIAREENKWKAWEEDNLPKNLAALQEMKDKFVPEEYRAGCSVQTLMDLKGMKQTIAERVFKNKIFKFFWMEKDQIAKLHAAALLNDYAAQGLDIRELRAVYAALPDEFMNDNDGKKKQFRENMRSRLFDLTTKEEKGSLSPPEALNNAYRDKAVKANKPKLPKQKIEIKANSKMKSKAAALEAFFNKQGGGAPPPAKKAPVGGSKPSNDVLDPNDSQWKKYFNMQKMNLPDGAISGKMVQDGLDGGLWEKLKAAKENGGSAPASSKPKEEAFNPKAAEWQKYAKMQKMGLAEGAIKNKMIQDGKDPSLLDKILNAEGSSGAPAVEKPLNPDDEIWAGYFRMRKMGLGEGQIMNKMQQDGRDPNVWSKLCQMRDAKEEKKEKAAAPASLSPFDFAAPPPKTQPKPEAEARTIKASATETSAGTTEVDDRNISVSDTMKEMIKKKRTSKTNADGKKTKRKKKKSSKKMSVTDLNPEGKPSKRRQTKKGTLRGSKPEFHFLQTDANQLLSKMGLDDMNVTGKGRGSHAIGLMDIESKYGTSNAKRTSVHKKAGGRRKTLRNSKVGTGALQNDVALQEVIDVIVTDGEFDPVEGGVSSMKFGDVFDKFIEISDVLVGLLLKGKKAKQLKYKGDMLFKGIHDEVKITVLETEAK